MRLRELNAIQGKKKKTMSIESSLACIAGLTFQNGSSIEGIPMSSLPMGAGIQVNFSETNKAIGLLLLWRSTQTRNA
jgi:hypothetical protein